MEFLLSYESFINNPYDSTINFTIAREYEHINQYAAAISFYMRAAEYAKINETELAYIALINAAELFLKLGARINSVKSLVLQASALFPDHPSAYNILSKVYEIEGNWFEVYGVCKHGLHNLNKYSSFELYSTSENKDILKLKEELLFNLATSAYYIGKLNESKLLFGYLDFKKLNYSNWIQKGIVKSLDYIGYPVKYNELLEYKLLFKDFILNNWEKVDDNLPDLISYSQCLQDIFIASIIDNSLSIKSYIEIGSGDPINNNNTYLLEQLGWEGSSFDIDSAAVEKFNSVRKNKAHLADATEVDFINTVSTSILTKTYVDYLQFDCEPPEITLKALYNFPFNLIKAKIITFEHDGYRNPEVKEISRNYLKELGYEIIISDVSFNKKDSFEDWYCNPELMNEQEYAQCLEYKNIKEYTKSIFDIFIK